MTPKMNEHLDDVLNTNMENLLKSVIQHTERCSQNDVVAKALLYFLVRLSNTWQSIRVLQKHPAGKDGFMVDAGTLLRAMYDAHLQSEFIVIDATKTVERANDYLDFKHVDRYNLSQNAMRHDNPFTREMKSGPFYQQGNANLQQEYDRVKQRFYNKNGTKPRNKWYSGRLRDLAIAVNKEDELDIFLENLHGSVHSSATAVQSGPYFSPNHAVHWASRIVARVAKMSVEYNKITLDDTTITILEMLSKPFF